MIGYNFIFLRIISFLIEKIISNKYLSKFNFKIIKTILSIIYKQPLYGILKVSSYISLLLISIGASIIHKGDTAMAEAIPMLFTIDSILKQVKDVTKKM